MTNGSAGQQTGEIVGGILMCLTVEGRAGAVHLAEKFRQNRLNLPLTSPCPPGIIALPRDVVAENQEDHKILRFNWHRHETGAAKKSLPFVADAQAFPYLGGEPMMARRWLFR
ncbi:hypothetical protein HRbin17_00122 [bacterium HR17]|jgi:hypothetical protein|uniref:Uncharacterized protein n=1 Tax=Candidatus Fervidibacter japonicus TaxID=2035412 RepID=A0A2H5X905_9BACT|nr:hypothetical protein HRbin17_00122 [bacterium HR17]